MAKTFLAIVGVAHLGVAASCDIQPEDTAKIGGIYASAWFSQVRIFVVYGGLQLGLGIVFLLPLLRRADVSFALSARLILHGCLFFSSDRFFSS
jgi:hypothetical protein